VEGRPMKECVALPEPVYTRPEVFQKWLWRSFEYASSMKPKEKPAARSTKTK